jgi:TetR/AcrR family transcriptional regulator
MPFYAQAHPAKPRLSHISTCVQVERRQPQSRPVRTERTRDLILKAAETVFTEQGFAAARLEEIATRVSIRRASIVYYFKDKRELYEAVLRSVFGDLAQQYQAVVAAGDSPAARIEGVIRTWVHYVGARPSVARILLREAAAAPAQQAPIAQHLAPAVGIVAQAIREGQKTGAFRRLDPIHFIFAIVGATIFFVAATPTFVPEWPFDPLSQEQLHTLQAEVLAVARRLLGLPEEQDAATPARADPAAEAPTKRGEGT